MKDCTNGLSKLSESCQITLSVLLCGGSERLDKGKADCPWIAHTIILPDCTLKGGSPF